MKEYVLEEKNHDHVQYLPSYVYYSMSKNVGQLIIM